MNCFNLRLENWPFLKLKPEFPEVEGLKLARQRSYILKILYFNETIDSSIVCIQYKRIFKTQLYII